MKKQQAKAAEGLNDHLVGVKVRLTEEVYKHPKGTIVTIVSSNTVDPTLVYFKSLFFVPLRTNQYEVIG